MPINASPFYLVKEKEYLAAQTPEEKLEKLKEMLSLAPKHKGAGNLLAELKLRIAKLKRLMEKHKAARKGSFSLSIKKQGAAQVTLVGTTNTGKSTLLKQLTNAHVKITEHPFTTSKPQQGMLDYKGIKLQIVEIPAVVKNYINTTLGPTNLAIARQSELLVLMFKDKKELNLIKKELKEGEVYVPFILFKNQKNLPSLIWKNLNLIKIHTKQQGKKPIYPPLSLKKGAVIKDLAEHVHKDFIKQFKYARVWGKSSKFEGQRVGLAHKLKDEDIVELHIK